MFISLICEQLRYRLRGNVGAYFGRVVCLLILSIDMPLCSQSVIIDPSRLNHPSDKISQDKVEKLIIDGMWFYSGL